MFTSNHSTTLYNVASSQIGTLLYHSIYNIEFSTSVRGLAPLHFQRIAARLVSYYAFLKDCCFSANLLDVLAETHLFPLNHDLGTLVRDLGCYPFDYEAYPRSLTPES